MRTVAQNPPGHHHPHYVLQMQRFLIPRCPAASSNCPVVCAPELPCGNQNGFSPEGLGPGDAAFAGPGLEGHRAEYRSRRAERQRKGGRSKARSAAPRSVSEVPKARTRRLGAY